MSKAYDHKKSSNKGNDMKTDSNDKCVMEQYYESLNKDNNNGSNNENNNNNNMDEDVDLKENIKDRNSIHSFICMNDAFYCLDYREIYNNEPAIFGDNSMNLRTIHGSKKVKIDEYIKYAKIINPDCYLIPSQDILYYSSSTKCSKNSKKTVEYFNKSIEAHKKCDNNSPIIACIQGGNNILSRKYCMDNIKKHNDIVSGYYIGGINFGDTNKDKHIMLGNIMNELPKDKLKIISGVNNLNDILTYIINGCDLIMSCYPTYLTNNGDALLIPFNEDNEKELIKANNGNIISDKINLRDKCYENDTNPILIGCKCFTCQLHSRAYLRHLFNVHEMNASILLQMYVIIYIIYEIIYIQNLLIFSHNLYRFLKFVDEIRTHINQDKIKEYYIWWMNYQNKL